MNYLSYLRERKLRHGKPSTQHPQHSTWCEYLRINQGSESVYHEYNHILCRILLENWNNLSLKHALPPCPQKKRCSCASLDVLALGTATPTPNVSNQAHSSTITILSVCTQHPCKQQYRCLNDTVSYQNIIERSFSQTPICPPKFATSS